MAGLVRHISKRRTEVHMSWFNKLSSAVSRVITSNASPDVAAPRAPAPRVAAPQADVDSFTPAEPLSLDLVRTPPPLHRRDLEFRLTDLSSLASRGATPDSSPPPAPGRVSGPVPVV
jgi:hypothetical protein